MLNENIEYSRNQSISKNVSEGTQTRTNLSNEPKLNLHEIFEGELED